MLLVLVDRESPRYEVQFVCWNRSAISLHLRANRNANFAWGTVPEFELGGRVWYHLKVLHISYDLFAGTEMLSLSVYEPTAIQMLLRDCPPIWGGVELGGRLWYRMKVLCSRYNLFAGTETLSLSVYEPITIHILLGGTVPQFRVGG